MADLEAEKALAALRAVDEVESGMLVGLGTGSTAVYAIRELGRRVARGLTITAVATSNASDALARQVGMNVLSFEDVAEVDVTIDGADEITPGLTAIKGGGGALLREKVVAAASRRVIIIVDSSKPVATLGKFKLPLEVIPFAISWVKSAVACLGVTPEVRVRNGVPFRTDQANFILDLPFESIADPQRLALALDAIPGVVEHGLFLNEIDAAVIARGSEVEVINRQT
ncbi:ribose-5-phosphate isomerase RpiA [Bradyrhizobium sp. BRP23]|uniref:ribose-5-phosphate isomerase RpiA n=1 Tax=Bradyrhizobium sp. BRP23 TaxID=2793820 RepID=UPI001CD50B6F|nr:ribose-5-phosphate isomerase RpiA [Bradyrhizobium sp. BRP23]MCA1381452.1 ribose-5-phosphate isomerase RpiA [Bradyrhizobium sp. BRP05]MCA1422292.1 ribose-5-phosphate isomerase RpiA [Bradyrhizobium sp. BRP23]